MKNYSIIIPVYNEANILKSQIRRIVAGLNKLNLPVDYEILLVENGSRDNTRKLIGQLLKRYKNIRRICLPFPSYGQAFKEGIKKAKYSYIFQFDIDFWQVAFIRKAQTLLEDYDFVIGSKNLNGSKDNRSFFRRSISRLIEKIIEFHFNTELTDTHGIKALKKSVIGNLIADVKCSNHFFDSELLLRAAALGHSFAEVPVSLKEIRASRFPFYLRFGEVIKEFLLLMKVQLQKEKHLSLSYKFQATN